MRDQDHRNRGAGEGPGHDDGPAHQTEQERDRRFDERHEQLARDIRQMAEDLRVPVSNLVRNVLEETFSVVESVTDDMGDLLEDVIEQAERASDRIHHSQRRRREREAREAHRRQRSERPEAFDDIEAWQPVVLNVPRRCDGDGREIRRGEQAFVGLTSSGLSGTYLCPPCVEARREPDAAP
jgi:hypothetical protein